MTIVEVSEKFPTEETVNIFFENVKWKDKPTCPYCLTDQVSNCNKDGRFYCKKCRRSFSVTTDTHLHRTRIPLKTWLFAFAIISDAKKGLSALQLKRHLGLSYKTAFAMYHTIRSAEKISNYFMLRFYSSIEVFVYCSEYCFYQSFSGQF